LSKTYRVGLDIGGTFTDFVLLESGSGALHLHKRLTTPDDPAVGALLGLRELLDAQGLGVADVDELIHGTTLVTNALIERRGSNYRVEVDERVTREGEPLRAPDLEAVRRQVEALVASGVEALAICFLHSYRNPSHERAVAEYVRGRFPQLSLSVSSEVVPEIREYERTATTVCNAYVQPLMARYLNHLEQELEREGFAGHFYLMQSSGGSASLDTARKFPIRFLESGPAGGALVSAFLGRFLEMPDLLSFDMGGTTAKACLIMGGKPTTTPVMEAARVHRFKHGSGLPVKAPVVDMIEIGAGGGSIAGADSLGLLKVGPRSAGADPGPACYGLGGTEATVTDACLALGYFDPEYFLGGTMALAVDEAHAALAGLGGKLDLSEAETAWGVFRIVCENMAGAARVHIIEKGQDPRRFKLMAFGGAGAAHAARVARILGAPEVMVPQVSGVASALGFLVAPISFEFSRSYPGEVELLDWTEVNQLYRELEQQARAVLEDAGVERADMRLERRAEMRFVGQFHEIEVEVPAGSLTSDSAAEMIATFEAEYSRLYHAVLPGYRPMVLNWRLRALGPEPEVHLGMEGRPRDGASYTRQDDVVVQAHKGTRQAYFPEHNGFVPVEVYDRYLLPAGACLAGPVIVEERESTTMANPGDVLTVDDLGNLHIEVGGV
jgi:5-oxoprolinase (ATP-hydrolysing)/N-methylhydantoinase A